MREAARERGTTAFFFVACILPLLFFLLSLSVDVSAYFRNLRSVSEAMDEAAIHAYRFLPDAEAAAAAARAFLAARTSYAGQIEAAVDADGVSLTLHGESPLLLAGLLGVNEGIPLHAAVRARGTPYDVLLAVDTGSYLAPDLGAASGWGGAEWPSATFFAGLQPVYDGIRRVDPVVATQQCFNPAFSALKAAAITAYRYFAGFGMNNVGLAFYPGRAPVDLAARVAKPPSAADADGGLFGFSTYCAAAAENEQQNLPYRFPVEPGAAVVLPRVLPGQWAPNPDYRPPLPEAIWSRAVSRGIGSFGDVLRTSRGALAAWFPERRGLTQRSQKAVIVFAGDAPWSAGARFPDERAAADLREKIAELRASVLAGGDDLRIYYVVFPHPGNGGLGEGEAEALGSFFQGQSSRASEGGGAFAIQLIYAADFSTIARQLLGVMLLDKKTAVLAK